MQFMTFRNYVYVAIINKDIHSRKGAMGREGGKGRFDDFHWFYDSNIVFRRGLTTVF